MYRYSMRYANEPELEEPLIDRVPYDLQARIVMSLEPPVAVNLRDGLFNQIEDMLGRSRGRAVMLRQSITASVYGYTETPR